MTPIVGDGVHFDGDKKYWAPRITDFHPWWFELSQKNPGRNLAL
jgi:hypothetical protein